MSATSAPELDPIVPAAQSPRRRRRAPFAAALVAAVSIIATACVPPDFVKHTSGNLFSWFAPPSWIASHSSNGIQITDAIGSQWVILAFAPTPCASGATFQESAVRFFNQQRAAVRDGSGLTQWRTLSASTPRLMPENAYGPLYFRQDIQFSGVAPNGTTMRGEGELDYQFTGFGFGCQYRTQIRMAPNAQFANVIARLRATQSTITYFPPGV